MQRRIAAALGAPPEEADRVAPLVVITTSGDRIQDRRLLEVGGKGLFTKEIEEALLDGRIDCAIHSLKDMPVAAPEGLVLAAIPEREDPRDAFLSLIAGRLEDLPRGARLGTASLRRQAQSLNLRPDLDVRMLRGNVDTRLEKLRAGEADAILLAASGLNRLGLGDLPRSFIDPRLSPPAPGQGALAVQTREADRDLPWLESLRHAPTALAVAAERGAMTALEGSCRTAVGAHAEIAGGRLRLTTEMLAPDGAARWRRMGEISDATAADAMEQARALGLRLGAEVQAAAGDQRVAP
jgi:hydroxymethylbilane synthase